jgi:hypothetical protein
MKGQGWLYTAPQWSPLSNGGSTGVTDSLTSDGSQPQWKPPLSAGAL